MSLGELIALGGILAFVVLAAVLFARRRRRHGSSQGNRGSSTGRTVAVHDPSDDPHWQAYSARKSTRKARRRRKIWAAGTAGAVGAGSTDGSVGCGAGCSGGGCGGGGCGGGGG